MSNAIVYHGITVAENSKIYNLEVEQLEHDPNPIRIGRIWFDLQTKHFKYTTLDDSNHVIIRTFSALTDIPSYVLDANNIQYVGNSGNQFVNLPVNNNLEIALNIIVQHLNNIYSKLNTSSVEYFLTNSINYINTLVLTKAIYDKKNLTVIINGLEQNLSCFTILSDNKTIQFIENLPLDSIIKTINIEIL